MGGKRKNTQTVNDQTPKRKIKSSLSSTESSDLEQSQQINDLDQTQLINNNLDFDTLNLSILDSRPIILVEKREFVEYQNKTNLNINNMISYLNSLGDEFQKTNELISKQSKIITELEKELRSLRNILNITKKDNKFKIRSVPINHNFKDRIDEKLNNQENIINKDDTINSNTIEEDSSKEISNENIVNLSHNSTILYNLSTRTDEMVEFYPNSKLSVNRKRLLKCLKSVSYTAFVSKILTSLSSVEDLFMKNLKGGKSISMFNLQKQRFRTDYVLEIYNAVVYYFPNQLQNLPENEWKKEVNKAINSKLFVINRHLNALILNETTSKYKLSKSDTEHFRDYDAYSKDPNLFFDLLARMYGENALNSQAFEYPDQLNDSQFNEQSNENFEYNQQSSEYNLESSQGSNENNLENNQRLNNSENNEKLGENQGSGDNIENQLNNLDKNNNLNRINEIEKQLNQDNLNNVDLNMNLNCINNLELKQQFGETVILDQDFFDIYDPCANLNNAEIAD